MKIKNFLSLILAVIFIISCEDDKNTSDTLPKFKGITQVDRYGLIIGSYDPSDWRIDDNFIEVERNLFDTLNFDNTFFDSGIEGNNIIDIAIPQFYPNPLRDVGYFRFNEAAIMNIVIVDKAFTKKIESRINSNIVGLDFSIFNKGIYRMYYVFQNSDYKIIGMGHGDIQHIVE